VFDSICFCVSECMTTSFYEFNFINYELLLLLLSLLRSLIELTSGLESREYGHRDSSRWPGGNLYPQKLALTSPTSGGLSVGIACSRTKTTEFSLV
jgi:hypothetical protein